MSNLSDKILFNEPLSQNKSFDLAVHSIIRNIQYILNTRSSIGVKRFLSEETVLDNLTFGLPDLSFLALASSADKETLSLLIKKAIIAFEPRLKNITIDLGECDILKREINIKVLAHFNRNDLAVNFLLNLSTLEFLVNERERK